MQGPSLLKNRTQGRGRMPYSQQHSQQHAQQLSLFDKRNQQTLLLGGFVASMKGAMRRMVEQSGLSRAQVVDQMNAISKSASKGRKHNLPTLEKWLADEERGQLPNLLDFETLQLATGSRHGLETWLAMQRLRADGCR